MNNSDCYKKDHLIAKTAVLVIYLVVGIVGIETGSPYLALVVGTPVWLFGVNTLAYFVESLLGHAHRHHWV